MTHAIIEKVEQIIAESANVPGLFANKCAVDVVRAVLDAIAEPSETQMAAAKALPVTKVVDGMITTTAIRYGGIGALPGSPDTPLQQWYRAMVAALLQEIKDE